MSAWIGVIGTLSGAALAGILMYVREYVQRKHSRNAEKRALLISKHEALYGDLELLRKKIGLLSIELIGHTGLDLELDLKEYSDQIPIERILMLGSFYAPSLIPDIENLKDELGKYFKTFGEVAIVKRSAPPNERLEIAERCMSISDGIEQQVRSICAKLSSITKQLIHDT